MGTAWLAGCSRKEVAPVRRSSFLLNTFVTVTLYEYSDETALDGCIQLCADYEKLLSKTMESSEIYKMNHRAKGERTFTVSDKTAQVLAKGLEYCRLSDGAFDITIEPLSSLWDFTAQEPQIPSQADIDGNIQKVGYKNVILEGNTVTFLNDETAIDLGAIAKGFIADEMKTYLEERGVTSALINLGGNLLCIGGEPGGAPFKVGIQKPYASYADTAASLKVRDLSVVSSGVYERHFIKDGVNYHHILDPRTGYPYANGLTQVSIISEKSVDGDGLSTACFALGLEKGKRLIESMDNTYGIFITEDGKLHFTEGAESFLYGRPGV
ncbi:MAG: FAD:protein FMN transferase [Clostridiaceae bacterium]|uniref:FAD:protein FMN transferase n=1 Tax=Clostridium porci TaxID=2605778 RepID=A0A7X2TCW1_9CLOT|nr:MULTISPECIES: FAD:protein FMN transferase [Clostridium]MCI6140193.1 FAD:protein FMN transferase [Clostridium sp.]MDU3396012.1 FAD:protein FMN transferase [Clostridiales bacterium]MDY3231798.1 FAD:protein FMN transferase [Clostridiaceae bacterium]MSS36341.1 FAD:protein FMN transferase [Clostridium porci]